MKTLKERSFCLRICQLCQRTAAFFGSCRDWDCKGKGFEGKVKLLGLFMMQVDF